MRRQSPHDYRRVRWKNGLGWTCEIAVDPPEGEWDWRISIATVDADSEFSRFPGIDRSLLVLEGGGMVLEVEGQGTSTLVADGPPLAFSGDVATSSRLLAGPTQDFNVMTRRGVVTHTLRRCSLAGSLVLERATTHLIYAIDGQAKVIDGSGEESLSSGESVLVDDQPRVTLSGRATLVLVQLHRIFADSSSADSGSADSGSTEDPSNRAAKLPG